MRGTSIISILILISGYSATAAEETPPVPPAPQAQPVPGRMACRQQRVQAMSSVEQALKTIDKAQESKDAALIEAALTDAEKSLRTVQQHMTECGGMMRMHRRMGRGMGRGPQGPPAGIEVQQASPAPAGGAR